MADPYPFPSNVHVLSSVTLKLNDTNYLLWKTQFESLLASQKLLGFVNGGAMAPPVTDPQFEDWYCTDQLVRSWLFGTLSEEVLGSVHNIPTSRAVWLSLAENFNKSSIAREFSLRRSLQLLTKKDKTLAVYTRDFKAICDSLSAIGKPIDESLKIFGYLNGLGREFNPISTVIQSALTKISAPTFNDVISEVESFDTKLKSYEAATNTVTPHMAFQTQSGPSQYNPRQNYNQFNRGRGHSYHNRGGRGGYTTRGRGFYQHQSSQTDTGERPICQICGRIGHTALKCYNRFDNNYQSADVAQAFTSLKVADDSGKEWYPDSGSSAHVTSSTTNLHTTTPYEGNDTVMVGDGTFLPITHVGSTNLTSPSEGGVQGSSA